MKIPTPLLLISSVLLVACGIQDPAGSSKDFEQDAVREAVQPKGENRPKKHRDDQFVLSLDGGGMLGLVQATIIAKIEEETLRHAYEVFDLIGGVSTGGLIALGLTQNGQSIENIAEFYEKRGPYIFHQEDRYVSSNGPGLLGGYLKYSSEAFDEQIEAIFGTSDKLENSLGRVAVYVTDPIELMRSGYRVFDSAMAAQNPEGHNCLRHEVARATATIPNFWSLASVSCGPGQSIEMSYGSLTDGAIAAGNDPAKNLYNMIAQERKDELGQEKIILVSIGNGLSHGQSPILEPGDEYFRLEPEDGELTELFESTDTKSLESMKEAAQRVIDSESFKEMLHRLKN